MTYDWYLVANLTDFLAEDLVSQEIELNLEGIGIRTILITHGNKISITFDDVFLSISLNEKNPFEFDGHAVYLDNDNNIYLGIEVE